MISAAKTRGDTSEAMEGHYMGQMPAYITAGDGTVARDPHDADQNKMQIENDRVRVDLIMAMPGGRLIKIVNEAVSQDFPEGCVYAAIEK